jgi:hypothetical protein
MVLNMVRFMLFMHVENAADHAHDESTAFFNQKLQLCPLQLGT